MGISREREDVEIVACKTIARELERTLASVNRSLPVRWIDSELHDFPKLLRKSLQETLDQVEGSRVLLAMGFCGNALAGIRTGDFELIFPRVDDCISLLFGSVESRQAYRRTLFLTRGWLDSERNIYRQYLDVLEKYGQDDGREIFKRILAPYECLAALDTHVEDYSLLLDDCVPISRALGLDLIEAKGDECLLKELISGPWPQARFCHVPPNTEIDADWLLL